jgi:hypothetical protein
VFLLRSDNGPRTATLNAIPPTDPKTDHAPETDDERKARHLRMLRELAELAMELAMLAAQRAGAAAASPSSDPETAKTTRRARTADPAALFTRLSRSVQQSIALEARLAAGQTSPAREARGRTVRSDPRRSPLRNMVTIFTAKHPDQTALQRRSSEQIDTELAADPEQTVALCAILETVCEDLGIKADYNLLPNDLLRLALPPASTPKPAASTTFSPKDGSRSTTSAASARPPDRRRKGRWDDKRQAKARWQKAVLF